MALGLDSLFQLQQMSPEYRDALMSNMGLQKSSQQGMNDLMSQLAQQVMQAQGQQQVAESDYRNALRQPPPSAGPGEVTRSLFGNIASAVSGQPQFAQQAQQANASDLSNLMEARRERLAALHDQVMRRSELAAQLGNLKLSTSLHQQAGQLERALGNIDKLQQSQVELGNQKALEGVKHGYEMELQKLKNEGSLADARARANATAADFNDAVFSKDIHTEPDGRKWFDASTYTGKALDRARKYAADNDAKLLGKDDAGQLQDINSSLDNIDRYNAQVRSKLPKSWADPKRLVNLAAAASGADTDLAGAAAFFPTKIRALRAEVGRGSFRMTQPEVNAMERTGPNVGLPLPVWDKRVEVWKATLNTVKNRILGGQPDSRTRFNY